MPTCPADTLPAHADWTKLFPPFGTTHQIPDCAITYLAETSTHMSGTVFERQNGIVPPGGSLVPFSVPLCLCEGLPLLPPAAAHNPAFELVGWKLQAHI